MKIITLALWRRPDYTRQVLESLAKCPQFSDYLLIIGIDGGGDPDVEAVAKGFNARAMIDVRDRHIGCNQNTKLLLQRAFSFPECDYVIHLEDDTPVAPDALTWFEWAGKLRENPNIFTVSGYAGQKPKEKLIGQENTAIYRPYFSCWGWATWRDRWQEMRNNWPYASDYELSWCRHVNEVRSGRCQIEPFVSRTNNIGDLLGTHRGSALHEYWAGSPGFQPQETFWRA